MMDELLILKKIKEGDIKAFEELFRRYYFPLCCYAAGITGQMAVAEEIVEELFYVLWKERVRLQIFQSVKSYLYRATRNQSLQYCEHEEVRNRYREAVLNTSNPEQSTDPHQQMEYEELQKFINNTLEKLPVRRRQIFEMHRLEGRKYVEIATQLSLSVKTVEAEMTKALRTLREEVEIYKIKTDQAWNRLYNRLDNDRLLAKVDERSPIRKHSLWIRYGAVAAVLIGVIWGALYWMTGSEREPAQNFLTQENQGISTLATTLEDGSVVLLAKETSLLYPEHFIADKREVSLQGNAFFDVAKKQGQPFWIDTEQAKIEVLGTAFSVQSDEHAPFRLSVQRGIVKVTLKKGNQECYVKAGEAVVVQSQRLVVLDADKENEEWGSFFKHIRFKDESLANILKVMNLNSDSLQIQVASPALEERRLTVEFSDESSEVVATLIASALGLQCVRQGDILLLSE